MGTGTFRKGETGMLDPELIVDIVVQQTGNELICLTVRADPRSIPATVDHINLTYEMVDRIVKYVERSKNPSRYKKPSAAEKKLIAKWKKELKYAK